MPITWTIDHEQRMLTAICQGDVTLLDLEEYLDAVVVAGSMPYRKLFDGTRGDSTLTDEEMMLLGARIRAYHTAGVMGPLAIVMPSPLTMQSWEPGRVDQLSGIARKPRGLMVSAKSRYGTDG